MLADAGIHGTALAFAAEDRLALWTPACARVFGDGAEIAPQVVIPAGAKRDPEGRTEIKPTLSGHPASAEFRNDEVE